MSTKSCIMIVEKILTELMIPHEPVQMGYVVLLVELSEEQEQYLQTALKLCELTILHNRKEILIEQVKSIIIYMIRNTDKIPKVKSSLYIIRHFPHTYTYISKLFYKETGITLCRYIINLKMEFAKELLDDGYTLDDIAYKLGYNDAAHLSKIFKKTNGLTPREYRQSSQKNRTGP
jgi:AraC-like DNA-binding protein